MSFSSLYGKERFFFNRKPFPELKIVGDVLNQCSFHRALWDGKGQQRLFKESSRVLLKSDRQCGGHGTQPELCREPLSKEKKKKKKMPHWVVVVGTHACSPNPWEMRGTMSSWATQQVGGHLGHKSLKQSRK
jgi:hypothetical protein